MPRFYRRLVKAFISKTARPYGPAGGVHSCAGDPLTSTSRARRRRLSNARNIAASRMLSARGCCEAVLLRAMVPLVPERFPTRRQTAC